MTSSFPDLALSPAVEVRGNTTVAADPEEEVVGLFDKFHGPLLRYLRALGLDAHDGEEVVQEVFIALFRHLREAKPRHNLRSWIFRVGHNLALKQHNRNRRHARRAVEAGRALTEAYADPSPDPEQQLVSRERQQLLRAVLETLPERDRWCLYLRAEGLRYREIGEVLGISLGAVSMLLARSLARLGRVDR
jgi:RNA polymerase sigma-70 factor, ECF subfamily